MKISNQKGISHLMLSICVVVIIACLGGILYFVQMKYKEEKIETLKTDMLAVQAKIKILSEEVAMKKEGSSYIGKKVSENLEDETIKKLIDEGILVSEDYETFYILENEDLQQLKVKNTNLNKIIVDYSNSEVIYLDGFIIKEKTYYKLSDFKLINEENQSEETVDEQENENQTEQENNN